MTHLTKFSFGTTSAIVTSLAFIISLSESINSKLTIIVSLLVFAVADNISDSLGLHIFQESDLKKPKVVSVSTFSNFFYKIISGTGLYFNGCIFTDKICCDFFNYFGYFITFRFELFYSKRTESQPILINFRACCNCHFGNCC